MQEEKTPLLALFGAGAKPLDGLYSGGLLFLRIHFFIAVLAFFPAVFFATIFINSMLGILICFLLVLYLALLLGMYYLYLGVYITHLLLSLCGMFWNSGVLFCVLNIAACVVCYQLKDLVRRKSPQVSSPHESEVVVKPRTITCKHCGGEIELDHPEAGKTV